MAIMLSDVASLALDQAMCQHQRLLAARGLEQPKEHAMQITDPVAGAALATLAHSKAYIKETRRLLSETRYRIAASRRHLNRAFALTGGSDDERMRAIVRARLRTGVLWPVSGQLSAGYGRGKACVVCGSPIAGTDMEFEVDGPNAPAVTHLVCFRIWERESETLRKEPRRATGAILATLEEAHSDHIVLNDHSRILLTPDVWCSYPAGTRLHVVYAESDGKKIALSIERRPW